MKGNKIYITISDERLSNTYSTGGGSASKESSGSFDSGSDAFKSYAKHELAHLIKDTVQSAVSFSISQIGNLSGDYALQRQVNNAAALVNRGRNLIMSAAGGFVVGGIPGAIVGAAVSLIDSSFQSLANIHNQTVAVRKQNYEIEQLRARVGMNSSNGGNRDTEY